MWTPTPFEKNVKYFVSYQRLSGDRETIGPFRGKDEAEGLVSEWTRRGTEAQVEEWEPVRAYTRGKVA